MRRTLIRIGSWPLALALILWVAASTLAQESSAAPPIAAPGRLIDLGGWRLHLHCTGRARAGQPTVILEAGAGDFSVDWSLVQRPAASREARVCAYDRAGSGWSDLGPRPRTRRQLTWELRTLLEKAGVPPPYILVGHSAGGLLARVYASTYRSDVAGLVLVDSGDEYGAFTMRNGKPTPLVETATGKPVPAALISGPLREEDVTGRIRTLVEQQIRQLAPRANDPPRDKLPANAQRMRAWSFAQVKHHVTNDNPFDAEELAGLAAQRRQQHFFGDMPLIALTRGLSDAGAPDVEAGKKQAVLASLSTKGKQVIATRSGHHIPLDEPELVVNAIGEILTAPTRRSATSGH